MNKPNIKDGERIVTDLLNWLKVPMDESVKNTPRRVAKMYLELFKGLYCTPPKITMFKAEDSYVCISDIYFNSICEHHLLPFMGKCSVVYHTNNGVVIGLSKIPRIVDYWSSRPQLQERLTEQIAEDLMRRLNPLGVYVFMSAEHSCVNIRGIKSRGCRTNTAVIRGDIDKQEAIRLLKI